MVSMYKRQGLGKVTLSPNTAVTHELLNVDEKTEISYYLWTNLAS